MMTKGARKSAKYVSKSFKRRAIPRMKRKANRSERRLIRKMLDTNADLPRKMKCLLTERAIT